MRWAYRLVLRPDRSWNARSAANPSWGLDWLDITGEGWRLVDEGPVQTLDQFTQWSERLHIPWAYMLATDLEDTDHTLTLTNTGTMNEKAVGATIRIHQLLAN